MGICLAPTGSAVCNPIIHKYLAFAPAFKFLKVSVGHKIENVSVSHKIESVSCQSQNSHKESPSEAGGPRRTDNGMQWS